MIIENESLNDEKNLAQDSQSEVVLTIGQLLKNRRQNLKMEVKAVASYLRIKSDDVLAIENDDQASVTKHLYVPGLVRAYAKFLKIDQKTIEEKIKLLSIPSNVENTKHKLINVGESPEITPTKDVFFNYLLIGILIFFVSLAIYNSIENKSNLITDKELITEIKRQL